MISDEHYMRRALELAKMGLEHVAPNPLVGAVIVHQGKIIGEGYHERYGEAHAEVNAVNQVNDKTLLKESTIYVTLEPCAHFGKTPPCADLLVFHQLKRVVVAMQDPFSKVSGLGIARMREHGIEVEVGLLEQEARELNKRFLTFHEKKRPYISLKWAQTSNGMLDIDRKNNEKGVFWITQPETKLLTHRWRTEEQAILVGANTVRVDNPELTTRAWSGRNPIRLILDPNNSLPVDSAVFNSASQSYHFTINPTNQPGNIVLNPFNLNSLLQKLVELEINSVLVEGGKHTLEQFITENLWDEARILTGTSFLESGLRAPEISGTVKNDFHFGSDHIQIIQHP